RNREAALALRDVHAGRRVHASRRKAGTREAGREGHREAAGVGRGDELFRVAARALLEARTEGVGAVVGVATQLHRALAAAQVTAPLGLGFSYRHPVLPSIVRASEEACEVNSAEILTIMAVACA